MDARPKEAAGGQPGQQPVLRSPFGGVRAPAEAYDKEVLTVAIAEDLAIIHEPDVDDAFHVEQHGIDFIPESERWATPRDIFGMWAGVSVQIEYFIYGAILMTFGLTFAQVVIIIVLGNLSYFLLGLCSLQGPEHRDHRLRHQPGAVRAERVAARSRSSTGSRRSASRWRG